VKFWCGRATVIEKLESQTLIAIRHSNVERDIHRGTRMSNISYAPEAIATPIPIGQVIPWAIFGGLLLLMALYFVSTEEGAMQLIPGMAVHEFVHDGRHLLGFPCH
jgi:hypothetical protein